MMTLNLNFLPEKEQKNIKTASLISWGVNVFKITLFLFILFNGFLFLINFLLSEQVSMLAKRSEEVNKNYFFYNQEVTNINEQLKHINMAATNYSILTPYLHELINTLPGEIQLKSIILDAKTGGISAISGIATDRNALLNYKEILENIDWITYFDLPTSQLIQKENINFNIILEIGSVKPK